MPASYFNRQRCLLAAGYTECCGLSSDWSILQSLSGATGSRQSRWRYFSHAPVRSASAVATANVGRISSDGCTCRLLLRVLRKTCAFEVLHGSSGQRFGCRESRSTRTQGYLIRIHAALYSAANGSQLSHFSQSGDLVLFSTCAPEHKWSAAGGVSRCNGGPKTSLATSSCDYSGRCMCAHPASRTGFQAVRVVCSPSWTCNCIEGELCRLSVVFSVPRVITPYYWGKLTNAPACNSLG